MSKAFAWIACGAAVLFAWPRSFASESIAPDGDLKSGVFITDTQGHRVQLALRPLPQLAGECENCHRSRSSAFVRRMKRLGRAHTEKPLRHSRTEMSCNNCHDANRSNYLRSSPAAPATFTSSSPVCQRCHADIYADWLDGMHGRRVGRWDGQRVQSHCIDCHDPHGVRFKEMDAKPEPPSPRFVIPKAREETE